VSEIESTPIERAQVIYSMCCNKLVAACSEPDCYTDKDWRRQIGKSAAQGCRIDLVSFETVRASFDICDCKKKKGTLK